MDAEHLFGMIAVAEEQQQAVKAALDGLAEERAAAAKERAMMAQVLLAVNGAAEGVRKAAGEAVAASMRQSLGEASERAAAALGEAARPVLGDLAGYVNAANAAKGQLNGAVAAFNWKWALVAGGATAGGIAAVVLTGWLANAWQWHQVESLSEQKAQLRAEVGELEASVAALEKKGGRIVMNTCGGRLCIEASNNQGNAAPKWGAGLWQDKQKGVTLVIPKGY